MYKIQAKTRSGSSSKSGSKSSSSSKSNSSSSNKVKSVEKASKNNVIKSKNEVDAVRSQKLPSGFNNNDKMAVEKHSVTYYQDRGLDPWLMMGAGYLIGNHIGSSGKEEPCVLPREESTTTEAHEVQVPDLPVCTAPSSSSGCVFVLNFPFLIGLLYLLTLV